MTKIIRIPVKSSQIAAIGHSPSTTELDIEFLTRNPQKPAGIYRYQNVTPEMHQALIGAESIGKHFGEHIKKLPGSYPFRRLSPDEAAQ